MASTRTLVDNDTVASLALKRRWVSPEDLARARTLLDEDPSDGLHDILTRLHLISDDQAIDLYHAASLPKQVGPYHIERKLGAGAMGNVYLGRDDDGQQAAVKVIAARYDDDEEFIKRFTRECDAVSTLDHAHIAKALDHGTYDGHLYLAVERVPGPSLADLLRIYGPLPELYVVRLMRQVADALDYAFRSAGIIHRDIKPENILTVPDPDCDERDGQARLYSAKDGARLIDFGLSKSLNTTSERLTMTGLTMGTPHYMSPEQITGRKDLDSRCDIYAMGCTMFHLLTGTPPYRGESPGAIMMAHVSEDVPDPIDWVPGLHSETRELVRLSMAKELDERYGHCRAFIAACDRAIEAITEAKPNTIRLLRKPMVRNDAGKRPTTEQQRSTTTKRERASTSKRAAALEHETDTIAERVTSKYRRQRQEAEAGEPLEGPDASRAHRKTDLTTKPSTEQRAKEALRKLQTERVSQAAAAGSAIDSESSPQPSLFASIGWMPLIVLVVALLALIGVVIARL